MNVLYAHNENQGILITCPHCKFGSRYDGSYVEDAIKIRHDIVCVACGDVFNLVVSIPISDAVEQSFAPDGYASLLCKKHHLLGCALCQDSGK